MKSSFGTRTVYIDCYDALGFFEENHERVAIIMFAFGESALLKREWVSGRAGGGSWARTLRSVFETDLDPIHIKTMMLGLQYVDPNEVPAILPKDADTGLFRFANLDVFNVQETSGEGRLSRLLKQSAKQIEMADIEYIGTLPDFLIACRKHILENLDPESRKRLLEIEQLIFEKIEADERLRS
ncbi:MAG: hypothetical protein ACFFCP_10960 [Promethearchaeota archaeon]